MRYFGTQDKLSELRGELWKEKQERIEAHAEIKRKLDNVAVGGLHLDVIGLWWLLFATIATSVPDGVAWMPRRSRRGCKHSATCREFSQRLPLHGEIF